MTRNIRVFIVTLAVGGFLAGNLALAETEISGRYLGNGQEAKLGFVHVQSREAWMDEPAWTIVLTEKDPSDSDNPEFAATFDRLGHALIIQITESGSIFGTQVCHQGLEKAGFSTSGTLKVEGFAIESGRLRGRFFTDGVQTVFGETWEVDLKVSAPMPVE